MTCGVVGHCADLDGVIDDAGTEEEKQRRHLNITKALIDPDSLVEVGRTGAAFPVVADPTWSLGWFNYAHLARWEVFKAYAASSYTAMGWMAFQIFQLAGSIVGVVLAIACGLYTFWALTDLGVGIYTAAHSVWNGPSACLTGKFIPVSGCYVGYDLNRCTY
jgi:hypothetical protein